MVFLSWARASFLWSGEFVLLAPSTKYPLDRHAFSCSNTTSFKASGSFMFKLYLQKLVKENSEKKEGLCFLMDVKKYCVHLGGSI